MGASHTNERKEVILESVEVDYFIPKMNNFDTIQTDSNTSKRTTSSPLSNHLQHRDNLHSPPSSINSNSTYSLHSHSNQYSYTRSKLLYSLDPIDLALIVKYTMQNEALFDKYKHQSDTVSQAFIDFRIKGKMVRKLTTIEFAEELPWIRRVITTRLHIWLKTLSDDDIISILNHDFINDIPHTVTARVEDTTDSVSSALPLYLRNNLSNTDTVSVTPSYDDNIVNELVALGYGTEKECIEASSLTVNYHDINEVMDTLTDDIHELSKCDDNIFQVFVYLLCVDHGYNASVIDNLMLAIIEIGLNGMEFMNIKRIDFVHELKRYGISSGIACKLYRLIMNNCDNVSPYVEEYLGISNDNDMLNAVEIAEIAVCDFEIAAHKLLECIDEEMEMNMVCGVSLVKHYQSKHSLEMYLMANMRHKSVNILVDILWNNYVRDRKREISRIKRYNGKQLLKYIRSLYMHLVKTVIINQDLNEAKFISLKRKTICDIFIQKCRFSAGVSTNIVDTISRKIREYHSI